MKNNSKITILFISIFLFSMQISFSQNSVKVGYKKLFKSMTLNPLNGQLKMSQLEFKNIPEGTHKLEAILKLNKKAIHTFSFSGILKNYSKPQWSNANTNSTFNITQAGKYILEFQLDGKLIDKVNLDIVQVISKNKVKAYYINKPLNHLAFFGAQNSMRGKPNFNSYFIFRFYTGILNPDGASVEPEKMNIRVVKIETTDNEKFIGGHFDDELRFKSWEKKLYVTDNYNFKKADGSSLYYKDIANTDGKYYIDLMLGADRYRYDFEIKNKELISDLSDNGVEGFVPAKAKTVEVKKYKGFRKTVNLAGKKDNVTFKIKSLDEKTTRGGYGAGRKPVIFTDGQIIAPSIYLKDNVKNKFMYKAVEFITTIKKGNEIIAQDIVNDIFTGYAHFSTIASHKDGNLLRDKTETYVFMKALSKLPVGNQKMQIIYEIASGKNTELIGVQKMTFKSKKGNPKYTKWAELTEQRCNMTQSQLSEACFLSSGSNDWAYYENNCGTIVWLRQDEDREYHLFSGDMGKFDRNGGTLEQWNFGTWKWNKINDFKPYKSIYKFSQNDIAILYMKQVPKDAIEKIKTIQDKEFANQDIFLKKIESLIGKDLTDKYSKMFTQQGRYDFVKICR